MDGKCPTFAAARILSRQYRILHCGARRARCFDCDCLDGSGNFLNSHVALHGTGNIQAANHKAYVYTELQISAPFENVPWERINKAIKEQPGFINKTWLAGVGNNSAGRLYAFDSIENAQKFVTKYFPAEARGFGVAQTTRVFDAAATEAASRDIKQGIELPRSPVMLTAQPLHPHLQQFPAPVRQRHFPLAHFLSIV